MYKSRAYTLIEIVAVIGIIAVLISFSFNGIMRLKDSLEYWSTVNKVFIDVRMAQTLAQTLHEPCRIDFKLGSGEYTVTQGSDVNKTSSIASKYQFDGKSYFSFSPSGDPDVGGSGTLTIKGYTTEKKIIVSSTGRVRIE